MVVLHRDRFSPDFLSIVALTWWKLWGMRNALVFEGRHITAQEIVVVISSSFRNS